MTWVAFLKEKHDEFEKFKFFKDLVQNNININIKCLRLDRGDEFTSNQSNEFCENHEIKRYFSATRTSQQNGVVEMKNEIV